MSASSKVPVYTAGLGITGAAAGAAATTQGGESETPSSLSTSVLNSEAGAEKVIKLEQPVPVADTVPTPAREKATLFETFWQTSPGFTSWNDWYFGKGSAIENVSIDSLRTAADLTSSNNATSFFKGANHKDVRSSLRIMTSRKQYYNKKFESSMTWFWSLRAGNKGFITINNAETTRAKRAWNMSGGFYLVEKDSKENKWNVVYKQEVSKELDFKIFQKYFPASYWYTRADWLNWDTWYTWNFSEKGKELSDAVCSGLDWADNCRGWAFDTENSAGRWEWSGDAWHESDNVWSWSDWDKTTKLAWYDYMYGDTNKFKIMNAIKPFFKGAWKVSSLKSWDSK